MVDSLKNVYNRAVLVGLLVSSDIILKCSNSSDITNNYIPIDFRLNYVFIPNNISYFNHTPYCDHDSVAAVALCWIFALWSMFASEERLLDLKLPHEINVSRSNNSLQKH